MISKAGSIFVNQNQIIFIKFQLEFREALMSMKSIKQCKTSFSSTADTMPIAYATVIL